MGTEAHITASFPPNRFIPPTDSRVLVMRSDARRHPRLLASALAAMMLIELAVAQQASLVGTLEGHTEAVYSVAWSPDGKTLATAGFDNTVRLWEATTRTEVRKFEGHTKIVMTVAISPDGKQILSGGNDNTARLWDYAAPDAKDKPKAKDKAKP